MDISESQVIVFILFLIIFFLIFLFKDFDILLNITFIHLDKNNHFIEYSSSIQLFISETIELDVGYKLNHYKWDAKRNILLLFIKPADYDFKITELSRLRKLILPNIDKPVIIKENYR